MRNAACQHSVTLRRSPFCTFRARFTCQGPRDFCVCCAASFQRQFCPCTAPVDPASPCTGGQTQEEAFRDALTTWHPGVRPIVHWSESQAGRKPHAHSDYIKVRPHWGPRTMLLGQLFGRQHSLVHLVCTMSADIPGLAELSHTTSAAIRIPRTQHVMRGVWGHASTMH